MPPRRGRRLFLLLLFVLLGLVLVAAAAGWFFRDLPRRRVEAILADRLQADVSLGRLHVEGSRRFVLENVRVRRMAGQPLLQSLTVARLTVEGGLTGIKAGEFDRLRCEGTEVRLAPPGPHPPPPPAGPPSPLRAGRLELPDARIVFEGARGQTVLELTGIAERVGSEDLSAEIRFSAGRLELEPILALAGLAGAPATPPGPAITDLEGELRAARAGRESDLEAHARSLTVALADRTVEFPDLAVRASVRPGEGGLLHLQATPVVPFAESVSLQAELDGQSWQPRASTLTARALKAELLAALSGVLPAEWRIAATADLDWSHQESGTPAWTLSLSTPEAHVTMPGIAAAGHGIEARASGGSLTQALRGSGPVSVRVTVRDAEARGAGWSLPSTLFPMALDADGTVSLGPSRGGTAATATSGSASAPPPLFDGTIELRTASAGTLHAMGILQHEEASAPSAGSAGAARTNTGSATEAPFSSLRARLDWAWSGGELAALAASARASGVSLPEFVLDGKVAASGRLEGPLAAPSGSAQIRATSLSAAPASGSGRPPWSVTKGTASVLAGFEGATSRLAVDDLSLQGTVTAGPMEPLPCTLTARRAGPLLGGAADIAEARLTLGDAGRLEASGRADLAAILASFGRSGPPRPSPGAAAGAVTPSPGASGDAAAAALHVTFDAVALPRLQQLLRPLVGNPVLGYAVSGTAAGDATVRMDRSGVWTGSGTAAVHGSGFSSGDGARVLQGLDTTWTWRASADRGGSAIKAEAVAEVAGFQLLWESLFADGKELPSHLEVTGSGTGLASGAPSWQAEAHWLLPEGPAMDATVSIPPGGSIGWTFSARVDDLAVTVRRYLRNLLGESIPFFRRIEAGGRALVEARGELARPQDGSRAGASRATNRLEGRVRLDGARLAGTQGTVEVSGLQVDLPVAVEWAADGTGAFQGPPLAGDVRFEALSVAGLTLPPTRTALRIRADSAELEQALHVSLLGGQVALERVRLAELLSPARHMEGAVVVTGVRMDRTATAFGLPPLSGEMNAVLPAFLVTPDTFHVEGGGTMSVFGGTVTVGDISGVDILSRYPQMTFSAEFRDIDLESVTNTFDFGEMSGTAYGWIKDCELFRGTPVRFGAEIRTQKRGSRTINVKAVNNLAILGTGGSAGSLGRGFMRFIRRFTYEALGMQMTLSEDQFLLSGLERSHGREMFLTGRLPFPIEIVNAQPGTPISFSEMLERVHSLDLGTATTTAPPEGSAAPNGP